jgi:hypothetical protein
MNEVPRTWSCRTCRATVKSVYVPLGWYTLARQQGQTRRLDPTRPKHTRLGLYCSIGCLERMLPRLAAETEVVLGSAQDGGSGPS